MRKGAVLRQGWAEPNEFQCAFERPVECAAGFGGQIAGEDRCLRLSVEPGVAQGFTSERRADDAFQCLALLLHACLARGADRRQRRNLDPRT